MLSKHPSYQTYLSGDDIITLDDSTEVQQTRIFTKWVETFGLLETIEDCKNFGIPKDQINAMIYRHCTNHICKH
jgi:hypothetical protein